MYPSSSKETESWSQHCVFKDKKADKISTCNIEIWQRELSKERKEQARGRPQPMQCPTCLPSLLSPCGAGACHGHCKRRRVPSKHPHRYTNKATGALSWRHFLLSRGKDSPPTRPNHGLQKYVTVRATKWQKGCSNTH